MCAVPPFPRYPAQPRPDPRISLELVHVLGRARAGDPTTAAARALCRRLAQGGRPGRLVAADPSPGLTDVARVEVGRLDRAALGAPHDRAVTGGMPIDLAALGDATLVVHTVDGGEDLLPLVPLLTARPLRVVHHGSAVGSDRRVLRVLRGTTVTATAADPAGRDELRSLGFADVTVLPAGTLAGGLDGIGADDATVANLVRHPGPRIVSVGPIAPNRSIELLIDAFADLITHARPSATLSICGPSSSPWYDAVLRRRVMTSGLRACEVVSPDDEASVVARLDHADAVVALHPAAVDPYLQRAAQGGSVIVAPLTARTASLPARGLVPLPVRVGRSVLTGALRSATVTPRRPAGAPTPGAPSPGAPATASPATGGAALGAPAADEHPAAADLGLTPTSGDLDARSTTDALGDADLRHALGIG